MAPAAWIAGVLAVALAGVACAGQPREAAPESLEQLVERVADIRDLDQPSSFDVRYIPRSELPRLLDELITDDDRELFAETTLLYRLLGYIENDQDYLQVYRSFGAGSILGLYAPDRDTLWVVHDDDEPGTFEALSEAQVETLAHEVVHALQDYHFNLDEDYYEIAEDLDRALAWTAIIEGDAALHEGRFSRKYMALPAAGRGPLLLHGSPVVRPQVSSAVLRELYFPYTTGPRSVERIIDSLGLTELNTLLADPPAGTTFVLHPERLDDGWAPETVTLPDLAAALGEEWERDSGGTFGEFHLGNYLQQQRSAADSAGAADGWTGDRYDVYTDGQEAVAVFRVLFEDGKEAGEFVREHDAMARGVSPRTVRRSGFLVTPLSDGDVLVRADPSGREVAFAIGSDEEAAVRALAALVRG